MKKLINDPVAAVREMLEGLADLSPHIALLAEENVVLRRGLPDPAARPVAVLSGGGSGHEPAHAGYVGDGMLTAAIAGDVFTSPSTDAVLAAIRAAAGPAGALLVVKNYTGDRLNFGLAAEIARGEGIPVEIVTVADDVALAGTVPEDRRRGIAGTVFAHKLAGAAAAAGKPLADVARIAREAAAAMGSMGVSLGPCHLPGAQKAGFALDETEMELGMGIHGEQGVAREPLAGADALAARILDTVLEDRRIADGARVALLVNGLGATTPLELAILARAALAHLRGRDIAVERAYVGNYLTALDMPGASLTLLPLDDARLALLDAPTAVPHWPLDARIPAERRVIAAPQPAPLPAAAPGPLTPVLRRTVTAVADALTAASDRLTDLDARAGDGDLGASMERGAAALRRLPDAAFNAPDTLLTAMSAALRRAIAGSSGPFYATALLRAARSLAGKPTPSLADWAAALTAATAGIAELGGARPGDRTMLDALAPAAEALTAGRNWSQATAAAIAGAEATATMKPRLGRASYLGERAIGVPDGGAVAVTVWMQAIAEQVSKVEEAA